MSRVNLPSINKADLVIGVKNGGTGIQGLGTVANAFGMVTNNSINAANQPVALDANAQIAVATLPAGPAANGVNVDSAFSVVVNQPLTLTISDYDSFKTYTVGVSAGSYTISGAVITYTAPATVQTATVTINGRAFTVAVTPVKPKTPTITSPTSGATGQAATVSVTSDAFVPIGDASTHTSSDWQLSTSATFASIFAQSINDTVNKTSWTTPTLAANTKYYLRVRYKSSAGDYSDYATTVNFTTQTLFSDGIEEAKLMPSDTAVNDRFGYSVSISADGSRVAISASTKSAAYVFLRTGTAWAQEAKLVASDPAAGDSFGCSISMSADGTRVVIGAYQKTGTASTQGVVYVYLRTVTTWAQEQKISATTPVANEGLGWVVSMSTDGARLVAGTFQNSASNQGAAYIFLRTGTSWAQEARLTASDAVAGDSFAYAVAMSTDATRIIVGAINKTGTAGTLQGAAYVYLRTGTSWAQEQKLLAGTPANERFGGAVAINSDGSRLLVGGTGPASYIFLRTGSTWAQEAKLTTTGNVASAAMTADGSRVIIGSSANTGTAYVYLRTGTSWAQEKVFLASDSATGDGFGLSVSMASDASRFVIGAYTKTGTSGANQGAAYIKK